MNYAKLTPNVLEVVEWAVDNGASGAFVATIVASDSLAWEKAQKAAKAGLDDETFKARHGHFVTYLWQGETAKAFARADYSNRAAMDKANVAPKEAAPEAFHP